MLNAHYLILAPKKVQEPRFVHATLRCYEAALRNLPAIVEVLENRKTTATELNYNTSVRTIDKKSTNIALAIGFSQLLDIYAKLCKCSLDVQNSRKFPTPSLKSVEETKEKIKHYQKTGNGINPSYS